MTIGDDVLISWDVLVMDSDWHTIVDQDGKRINPDRDIVIGDHVWIGARSTILKGARIAPGCVVAAGTVVTKESTEPNTILGGIPARQIRSGIRWQADLLG